MALSRHHGAAVDRPLSVQEITAQADDFNFSIYRPFQQWLRAARLLLTEASICEEDGNSQMAYLYLYRHAQLILDRLPRHPDYKNPRFREDLAQARRALQSNIQRMEQLKPRITQQYARYAKAVERRNAERQRIQQQQDEDAREFSSRRQSILSDDGYGDRTQSLLANENRELAIDLAHREIRRRDVQRQSTKEAGISPATVASRRKGMIAPSEDEMRRRSLQDNGVREAGGQLYEGGRSATSSARTSNRLSAGNAYHYPAVPAKEANMDWRTPILPPEARPAAMSPPPLRPAKESIRRPSPPPAPPKTLAATRRSPPPEQQSKVIFKPEAFTEAGAPLRTLLLPSELRTTFLNLAHPNTARNLETCGILCGTAFSGALCITTLVIPDQNATSDTCDTTETGDNDLFNYCDENNLLVCGWIHTHPSQSCFLSSRDLHTSSGYQVMLPEAIAIVCAPRHMPDYGIFRLTDPPGLPHVLECTKKGLFHQHDEQRLYTDAVRPGHVMQDKRLGFEVVDLRKGN
ncbi:AMSH-like protease sst2 [Teratosphaeria destructans]|uniref:AMSH-like protease sst2 n=1 Tax=Teratosphaeria destructans TaxID=418781 RepID=A0A9W7SKH5_9PEZI|nr:AMSH-like protease sst2 [Teratosphaeria destructans]